jgi:hypothetical protein
LIESGEASMNTRRIPTRVMALFLCAALAASGCAASARGIAVAPNATDADVRAAIADYVQRIPPGSPIRLDLANGKSLRATLMKATPDTIVVQPRTRMPEPPREIAMDNILRVTLETQGGSNIGKAIGIGAAAGAGAALAVFLIIAALISD